MIELEAEADPDETWDGGRDETIGTGKGDTARTHKHTHAVNKHTQSYTHMYAKSAKTYRNHNDEGM